MPSDHDEVGHWTAGVAGTDAPVTPSEAGQVVEDAIRRHFAACRARVPGFVDRHFSLRGTVRLHRAALGLDIARAPVNLLLAAPQAGLQAAGSLARGTRLGRALAGRSLLLRTDVERRIEALLRTEMLRLAPGEDALASIILADPRVAPKLHALLAEIGAAGDSPALRDRLEAAMAAYAGSRAAAAEITTGLVTLGAGALALKQVTPGAVTLGPALAALVAHDAAVASFPLGSLAGGLWYGLFPAAPSLALVAGLTGGLMLASASLAAFAGVVADPVQRRLGLHARRLRRMLDALERGMLDPAAPGFALRDGYVARLLDLFDLLGAAARLARGG